MFVMRLRRGETVPSPRVPRTDSRVCSCCLAGDHLCRPRRLSPPASLRVHSVTLRLPLYCGCADHHGRAERRGQRSLHTRDPLLYRIASRLVKRLVLSTGVLQSGRMALRDVPVTKTEVVCIRCHQIYKVITVVADRPEKMSGICPACRINPPNPIAAGRRR